MPGRTLTATAVSSGLLVDAVRRQFFRVVKTVAVLVLVQMMVRILLPGIAGTVMSALLMVVGMTAIATGAALSGTLTSVMVFGGSRTQWSRTVLRDGSPLPLVGLLGAAAVVGQMYLVWPAGADAWDRDWWALTGGLTVCVVGGIGLAPMLTQLVSRCSMRECNDMAAWYGFRTQDAVQA